MKGNIYLLIILIVHLQENAFGQNKIYTNYGNKIKTTSILNVTKDSVIYATPAIYGTFWKGYFNSNLFKEFPRKLSLDKKYISNVCFTKDSCIRFIRENTSPKFSFKDTLKFLRKRTHFYSTGQILNIYHLPKFMVYVPDLKYQAKFSKLSYLSGNLLIAIGLLDIIASVGLGATLGDGPLFRINGINGILFLANGIIASEIGKMAAKRTVRKYNEKIKLLSNLN